MIASVEQMRAKVRSWAEASTNRRILSAAVVVAVMTTVVRLFGMLKELLVAWRFGRTDEIDAFLVAFAVPSLAVSVVYAVSLAYPSYSRRLRALGAAGQGR